VCALSDETREHSAVQAAPHARSPVELKSIIEAERNGIPFLLWRDSTGVQQIFGLDGREHVTLGRRSSNSVVLSGDGEVSRTHAELELVGEDWTITDDGLSHNGTYVNGARIAQRKRLKDGDILRFGLTVVEYRCPNEGSTAVTVSGSLLPRVESLTEMQRKILVALCRPYKAGVPYATPASNNQIASEVFLGVDAVKNHLRILFQRFEIADLPQNQKRARLVECAFQWGLVSERDL
jgi:pSer/pThr/pTyr-binding forkhead associated (FHA) protein